MTGNERPDIYADGLREERCENCLHCCATVLRTVHGVEHRVRVREAPGVRAQDAGGGRMQLLGGAMSVIDWNGEARNILKAVRAVGYLEGMSASLWRLAGPEIADEAIVDYDKSVADIAALMGLEKRNYD